MRLFAAVVPPAAVLDAVAGAIERVRSVEPAADLRWTRPDQWHLTLGFYARVDDAQLPDLCARLGRAAQRHEVLRLRLAAAGRFDGRVLWLRVEGDREPLGRLAAATVAAAARAGIEVEHRPYRPHLTIARARTPSDLRPHVEALSGWSAPEWESDDLVLFRSHLGPRPAYEVLDTWPLRRPQNPRLP